MKLMPHVRAPQRFIDNPPCEDVSIPPSKPCVPWGYLTVLRLALGGALCGSFLGILAGGLLGMLYGALSGDISVGLDGALIGSVVLAMLGILYGLLRGDSA